MVIGFCDGRPAGAVYSAEAGPLVVIVPSVELPPAIPFTSHIMLWPTARQNAAEKLCVPPKPTLADEGEIVPDAPQVIVTLAVPDLEVSSVLVAATVTVAREGSADGAVYVAVAAPVPAIVPIVELPPAIPFTLQVTPVLVVPKTLAANTCAPPDGTLAVVGETVIEIAMLLSRFTTAEPLICESASLTALIRTFEEDGSTEGAA